MLEEANLNFPEQTEVSFELGRALLLEGREDEARPYLEKVIADEPDSDFAASAKTLLGTS